MRFERAGAVMGAVLGAGLLAVAGPAGAVVLTAGPAAAGTGVPQRGVSVPGWQLFGVAATSAGNAWAVGQAVGNGKTIILHWNGTAWKQVASPTLAGASVLYAVAATSATNAWAAGWDLKGAILQHWNGTVWK